MLQRNNTHCVIRVCVSDFWWLKDHLFHSIKENNDNKDV